MPILPGMLVLDEQNTDCERRRGLRDCAWESHEQRGIVCAPCCSEKSLRTCLLYSSTGARTMSVEDLRRVPLVTGTFHSVSKNKHSLCPSSLSNPSRFFDSTSHLRIPSPPLPQPVAGVSSRFKNPFPLPTYRSSPNSLLDGWRSLRGHPSTTCGVGSDRLHPTSLSTGPTYPTGGALA